MELMGRFQQGATEMVKGWKHLFWEERLRELGLLNLEKALRDFINIYEYLKGRYKADGARVFPGTEEATGTN